MNRQTLNGALAWLSGHEVPVCAGIIAALALAFAVLHAGRRLLRGRAPEDVLTLVAAGVASAVALTGMYEFFITFLPLNAFFRVALTAFLDLAIVTEAVRARRNMREFKSSGVDGAAMWWLTILEAVLSAMPARSFAEAVFRLSAPMVAAWLWHRGMSLERKRGGAEGEIQWRLTVSRALVRLGLAEPAGRTVSDVAAARRLLTLARASRRLRWLNEHSARAWRLRLAGHALETAAGRAVEHAALATDPARQAELLALIDTLCSAASLAAIEPSAPWASRVSGGNGNITAAVPPAASKLPAAAQGTAVAAEGRPGTGIPVIAVSGAAVQPSGSGSHFPSAAAARTGDGSRPARPRPVDEAEVDSLERALGIVAADRRISGAELGRLVGVGERQGRNLKTSALATLAEMEGGTGSAGPGSDVGEAATGRVQDGKAGNGSESA